MKSFEVVSINVSRKKGEKKTPVGRATFEVNFGIPGDAHAGPNHRQVSLLAIEDIETMRARGADVRAGDFAENITTKGIDLAALPIGAEIRIGSVSLKVTQIGKTCHKGCAIMQQVGDCVMPRKGIFAEVISAGVIEDGNTGSYDI